MKSLDEIIKEQLGTILFALCVKEAELEQLKSQVPSPAPTKE